MICIKQSEIELICQVLKFSRHISSTLKNTNGIVLCRTIFGPITRDQHDNRLLLRFSFLLISGDFQYWRHWIHVWLGIYLKIIINPFTVKQFSGIERCSFKAQVKSKLHSKNVNDFDFCLKRPSEPTWMLQNTSNQAAQISVKYH